MACFCMLPMDWNGHIDKLDQTGTWKLNFCGGDAVISGDNVWWIEIQRCIKWQWEVWSIEYRKCMATFEHLICRKKKTITWNQRIQCWTFWKGGELLKYLGGVVRSKDCRIKKWRGNEFAVMHTTSLYSFALLFENVTFEINIVYVYPVFLIDVGVWNLVCDSEERL